MSAMVAGMLGLDLRSCVSAASLGTEKVGCMEPYLVLMVEVEGGQKWSGTLPCGL